jgi:hypothetical protein
MSQHADISKEVLAKAVKFNLSHEQTAELLNAIFAAAEYDEEYEVSESEIPNLTHSYLRTQKDGLYGVSHNQIDSWMRRSPHRPARGVSSPERVSETNNDLNKFMKNDIQSIHEQYKKIISEANE